MVYEDGKIGYSTIINKANTPIVMELYDNIIHCVYIFSNGKHTQSTLNLGDYSTVDKHTFYVCMLLKILSMKRNVHYLMNDKTTYHMNPHYH